MAAVHEKSFHGEKAVWLTAGRYEAVVLPHIGANLVAFRDNSAGYRFLHEPAPEEMEAFRKNPMIHGIPVLFPPNRYEDGRFEWNGRQYIFPVNEESTGNHLHGFLYNIPWMVEEQGVNRSESFVVLRLDVTEEHPVYRFFPHLFTFKLRYMLSEDGLQQQVMIRNNGEEPMPCLLAFHTAVNAPFASGSAAADYSFRMTIGERWELNERMLPTGQHVPLTADEERMRVAGISPFFEPMDNHYTAQPDNGRNRMELTDAREGVTLVYDVGTSYKQWMIWNNGATEGFFCPEPQVNLVNAPNVQLPSEKKGLFSLERGEIWEETSRLYCIKR
ncbi:aldose 1-epimerase [Paenibacillus xerothermodurans]|uniref:Aldose 1-epimerase n=1 Tax=Paenibacillus xerothermodurans TaxID=1977292 RepID=A0A2W1N8R8_PAEXE|nr:aldose 1-epimerase [Paenibacillus xerothermodurans]PZE20050.1 aldose 1-epimerase [Paenibacillus xerothermodurans]